MIAIFDKSYQILSKKYPNAKFVIIQYNTKNLDKYKNQLEKTGWHVISTQDFVKENLNSEEYHFHNDIHPIEKAWDVIVDEIDKNNVLYKK